MYNDELEKVIESILFHNPIYIDNGLIEVDDFVTRTKETVGRMFKLRKNGCKLDKINVGKDIPEPSEEDLGKFEEYISSLRALTTDRRLQDFGKRVNKITTSDKPIEEKLNHIANILDSFSVTNHSSDNYLVHNRLEDFMVAFHDEDSSDHVSTGIPNLDRYLGEGMRNGEFIIIAGEPGNYKSTIAYNIVLNMALRQEPVMLFSYEVNYNEMVEIMISMLARVDSIDLKSKKYNGLPITDNHDIMDRINKAVATLKGLPIYLVDSNVKLIDIKLMAMKTKPKAIFIDYLQLMPDVGDDTTKDLERVTRQLKLMCNADVLNIPIVVLSQFSKKYGIDDGADRKLPDLKGSTSIGQNANIAIFSKSKKKTTRDGQENYVELNVVKNRNGVCDKKVELRIYPQFHLIEN